MYLHLGGNAPESHCRVKPGFSDAEADVAFHLIDLHSVMCAVYLHTLWRATQFGQQFLKALDERTTLVGASMARALIETAAAFSVESTDVRNSWSAAKQVGLNSFENAACFNAKIRDTIYSMAFGTKASKFLENVPDTHFLRRTNVLTQIKKADKRFKPGIGQMYEYLCDAVHPSQGSLRCFWTEVAKSTLPDWNEVRIKIDRSKGEDFEVTQAAEGGALWATSRLIEDLRAFKSCCDDLCLTARLAMFTDFNYYGLLPLLGPHHLCPCGSRRKSKDCIHSWQTSREQA